MVCPLPIDRIHDLVPEIEQAHEEDSSQCEYGKSWDDWISDENNRSRAQAWADAWWYRQTATKQWKWLVRYRSELISSISHQISVRLARLAYIDTLIDPKLDRQAAELQGALQWLLDHLADVGDDVLAGQMVTPVAYARQALRNAGGSTDDSEEMMRLEYAAIREHEELGRKKG